MMTQMQQCFVYIDERGYPNAIDEVNPKTSKGLFSQKTLDELKTDYPNIAIMSVDDALEAQEKINKTEPKPITQDAFEWALETLPPQNWVRVGNAESFAFLERYSGRITDIFVRIENRYWQFRDVYDLTHAQSLKKVEDFMAGDKSVVHYGRNYSVLDVFPEDDPQAANTFMQSNPEACLLCVQNGVAYIVNKNDAGTPVETKCEDRTHLLKPFSVTLVEVDATESIVFDCQAEDPAHAKEQAENAYPGCHVKRAVEGGAEN